MQDVKKCQVVGYGDSGGPLSCQDRTTKQWTIVGISSWGERCEDNRFTPGVFTKVQYYNNYVKQVLAAHSINIK